MHFCSRGDSILTVSTVEEKVHPLEPGIQINSSSSSGLEVYCYENVQKSIIYIWRSVYLEFQKLPSSYKLFVGENDTEVSRKHKEETIWHPASWITWKTSTINFPAFGRYCIGIKADDEYLFCLKTRTVNYWRVLQTVVGIVLFFSASTLSRNSFFHYVSGMSLGVLASVIILIFIVSKFIPKKSASYAVLAFGFPFILYLMQCFYYHFQNIIANYMDLLLAYVFIVAFVSFIVCYRLGPVENVRTFNIIQWTMQIFSAFLVLFSTEYHEISMALVVLFFLAYYVPRKWIAKIQFFWYLYFPPKVKLLTEMEYIEQGNVETKKGLEDLRSFCSSPKCNAWSTVTKLQDPVRFAKFVKGESHLTDNEILLYNSEAVEDYDDDDDDDENAYEAYDEPDNDIVPQNGVYSNIANGSAIFNS